MASATPRSRGADRVPPAGTAEALDRPAVRMAASADARQRYNDVIGDSPGSDQHDHAHLGLVTRFLLVLKSPDR